jgi:hypothetical protein
MSQNHEIPITNKSDTIHIDPVTLYSTDGIAYLKLLSDTVVNVTSADPVPFDLIVEDRSVLNIDVLSPDSTIGSEKHLISDTTFTYSFVPPPGESRITFSLTDRFDNHASVAARVTRSAPARKAKPLYHEIPVRPKKEPAVEEKITKQDTVRPETKVVTPPVTNEEVTTGKTECEGHCCLWWLLLLPVLIIFFILWRRNKKKKEEKNKA